MVIDELLAEAAQAGASDLHIKAGNFPCLRLNGDLMPLTRRPHLTPEDTAAMANSIMTERQKARFNELRDLDLAYHAEGIGRFRVNVFHEMGSIGLALRFIPNAIRTLEELHLPPVARRLCEERRGMVLVTGAAGSGKSTTLAAMVDAVNSSRAGHIITIEDPIEYFHTDKKGFVRQREVGVDTPSFEAALHAALRQDPDVILVGEMRDTDTIRTAIVAAETGHMVYSTLHTLDAQETVQRIIAVFPASEQRQVRLQLASTLKGVISQRLLRRADGLGRVPAAEVLVSTEFIRDCITNPEKTSMIRELLASGTSQYGMQTFDQSLYDLYSQGLIALDEACRWASSSDELKLRVSGVRSASDLSRDAMEFAMRSPGPRLARK